MTLGISKTVRVLPFHMVAGSVDMVVQCLPIGRHHPVDPIRHAVPDLMNLRYPESVLGRAESASDPEKRTATETWIIILNFLIVFFNLKPTNVTLLKTWLGCAKHWHPILP